MVATRVVFFVAGLLFGVAVARAEIACPLPPMRPPGQLEIAPATAVGVLNGALRACRYIESLELDGRVDPASRAELAAVGRLLGVQVLAPLGRDGADAYLAVFSPAAKTGTATSEAAQLLGPRTAAHLAWVHDEAERRVFALMKIAGEARQDGLVRTYMDLDVEIGAIEAPVYKAYPAYWRALSRKSEDLVQPRTAKSDAAFRKGVPAAGSVSLSQAAVAKVGEFMQAMKKEGFGCQIGSFQWVVKAESKKPGDDKWTESGPGVGFGAFSCKQVPPNAVRTYSGVRLLIADDVPPHFAGKLIDYEKGKFVLKNR